MSIERLGEVRMASIIFSPKDIFEQEFKTSMRGYDRKEVDEFLDDVIKDYENYIRTNLNETESWCGAGFCRGEAQLESMGKQMKNLPLYDEDSHLYLTAGIIKLFSMKGI